ncbi:Aste57867_4018 [Aphanomyces stellatus]|uniref:Aste57867_4018 protein n=1 Tax=Aphanomyces stellatus TaxID=120398 RepID=A0A485KBY2_9STRA|nr:hypothetical protein As57867_004007 [Aphanomyces stellatus]VFT81153.1 Aste57867_4018 [Aphanomyces stellatus]
MSGAFVAYNPKRPSTTTLETQRYMEGDIFLDTSIGSATVETNPKSVEFFYLPSGEILAKPTSSIAPPLQIEIPRSTYALHPSTHAASSASYSLQEQGLSPSSTEKGTTRRSKATPHQQRILELEALLQNEKKRSLDKMRLLLDEQDKSHDLQTRFAALQAKVTHLETAASHHAGHVQYMQTSLADANTRNTSLAADVTQKNARIESLTNELARVTDQLAALEAHQDVSTPPRVPTTISSTQTSRGSTPSKPPTPSSKMAATTLDQPVQTDSVVDPWAALVEAIQTWKDMADAVTHTSTSMSSPTSLESLLADFPTLARPTDVAAKSPPPVVAMLKRRLAFVEKEWRQTHAKYIELKELCARQCVREADLQNFNEHRLRGQCSLRLPSAASTSVLPVSAAPSPNHRTRPSPTSSSSRHPSHGHMQVVIKRGNSPVVDDSSSVSTTPPPPPTSSSSSSAAAAGRTKQGQPTNGASSSSARQTKKKLPTPKKMVVKRTSPSPTAATRPWV